MFNKLLTPFQLVGISLNNEERIKKRDLKLFNKWMKYYAEEGMYECLVRFKSQDSVRYISKKLTDVGHTVTTGADHKYTDPYYIKVTW